MQRLTNALEVARRLFFNLQTLTGLYVALVITLTVMGVRSSMFITTLVPVFVYQIGDVQISLLALAIAVAFVLFVSAGSYYAGFLKKGSQEYTSANWVRILAVIGDGLFNLAETVYVVAKEDRTKEVFAIFNPAEAPDPATAALNWGIRGVVVLGILGIGLIPTILALLSGELLGVLQQRDDAHNAGVVVLTTKDWSLLKEAYGRFAMNWFAPTTLAKALNMEPVRVEEALVKAEQAGIMRSAANGRYRFSDVNNLSF